MGRPKLRRPLTLRPAIARRIVDQVRRGNFLEPAAHSAGVTASTAGRWRQRGARRLGERKRPPPELVAYLFPMPRPDQLPDSPPPAVGLDTMPGRLAWLSAFAMALDLAEGEVECTCAGVLPVLGATNPTAMLEFLARRFPARWGRRTGVELTGAGGGPVKTESSVTHAVVRVVKLPELEPPSAAEVTGDAVPGSE